VHSVFLAAHAFFSGQPVDVSRTLSQKEHWPWVARVAQEYPLKALTQAFEGAIKRKDLDESHAFMWTVAPQCAVAVLEKRLLEKKRKGVSDSSKIVALNALFRARLQEEVVGFFAALYTPLVAALEKAALQKKRPQRHVHEQDLRCCVPILPQHAFTGARFCAVL
jgi:hypothetical protein